MNKKDFFTRCSIYAAIIIIVVPIVALIDQQIAKPKQAQTIPFGNVMSEYFYFVHTNLSDHNLVTKKFVDLFDIPDPELATFYRNLNWTAKDHDLITNYHSNGDSTWHSINADGSSRNNYLFYWQTIRAQIQDFYQQYLPNIKTDKAVVHFRCSDSPFNKHMQYHLTKTSSVKWMAEQIKQQGYTGIVLLNCHSHRTFNQTACEQYSNFYAGVFSAAGLSVEMQCNSILQDFALMVHSPLLVSLNVSSFSFMAGIAKEPSKYISCNMGMEIDGHYAAQTAADWILDPQAPLLHKDVAEYADVASVITKLND